MLGGWIGKKRLDATEPDSVRAEHFDASIDTPGSSSVEPIGSLQIHFSTDNQDQFRPTCTVVICTRNRPAELSRCLEAVANLDYPHFDVLVVDNAPRDDQSRQLALRWGARYTVEPKVGLSRARNLGARTCSAEILAFLDDDSFPEPEWLTGLARPFADPLVMAATGRIVAFSTEMHPQDSSAPISSSNGNEHREAVIDRQTPFWFERANFGGIGDGGNMAFRGWAFDVWPGFDERLGRGAPLDGGEEHNAFFSLLDLGYRISYSPDAVVRHPFTRNKSSLRDRHFKDVASAAAYVTLLFVEQPRYRRAILKYVLEAFRGTPRAWRGQAARPQPRILSRWRSLLAWLTGPLLYSRSLFSEFTDPDNRSALSARRKWADLASATPPTSSAARSNNHSW